MTDFSIDATDGAIGRVDDFLYDDETWTVRYIIVNTGGWFGAKKVLISPAHVDIADWHQRCIGTMLTRQEVRNSPPIDADEPVSRQHEADYNDHHGFPYYWAGPKLGVRPHHPGKSAMIMRRRLPNQARETPRNIACEAPKK